MSPRQRKEPGVRRAELVAAASELFAREGVEDTTVADIVAAAEVAQGTFYLYFSSKDAIICAVVEDLIDHTVRRIEKAVRESGQKAVEKLEAMAAVLLELNDEPHEVELMSVFHRPDNMPIHDRVTRSLARRLTPHVAAIVRQGVAEGVFVSEDPETSAAFIIGSLQGLETAFTDVGETRRAVRQLRTFVLRGLGYPVP